MDKYLADCLTSLCNPSVWGEGVLPHLEARGGHMEDPEGYSLEQVGNGPIFLLRLDFGSL